MQTSWLDRWTRIYYVYVCIYECTRYIYIYIETDENERGGRCKTCEVRVLRESFVFGVPRGW